MPCSKDLNKATIHISLNPIALLIECLKNSTCIFTLAIYDDDDIYIFLHSNLGFSGYQICWTP